jgi:hypothetical protein
MLKNHTCAKLQLSASGSDTVALCHCCIAVNATARPVPCAARAEVVCQC